MAVRHGWGVEGREGGVRKSKREEVEWMENQVEKDSLFGRAFFLHFTLSAPRRPKGRGGGGRRRDRGGVREGERESGA